MLDFRPPKDSPLLINTAKLIWPLWLRLGLNNTRVEIVDGALDRYAQAANQRGMICPNHSNPHDPLVIFELARRSHEDFNYIAAREVFDWNHGFNGWLMQRAGAFSVVRGAPDRESFKTSRHIIVEGKKKLVLFPEGEISKQNETVLPLETGAVQVCFWAVDELAKESGDKLADKPVFLVPVALRYTFTKDVRAKLLSRLAELEKRLNLKVDAAKKNAYDRLTAVSEQVLINVEEEFNCKPGESLGLGERVVNLRSHIVKRLADQLQIALQPHESQLAWVRAVRNAMDDFVYGDHSPLSDYQRRIAEEKARTVRAMYRHLDRVVNFISIYEGYLNLAHTQEHFTEMLERLEVEVLGHDSPPKGPRIVYLNVAEPINMTALYAQYKANKRKTIASVTQKMTNDIAGMIADLDKLRLPITVE